MRRVPFFAADGMAALAAPVGVIDSLGEPVGRGVGDLLLRAIRGMGDLRGIGDLLGVVGWPRRRQNLNPGWPSRHAPALGPVVLGTGCADDDELAVPETGKSITIASITV